MSESGGRQRRLRRKKTTSNLFEKLVQAQTDQNAWKTMGTNFMWVPDEEEGFIVGEITERKGEEVVVLTRDGSVCYCNFQHAYVCSNEL